MVERPTDCEKSLSISMFMHLKAHSWGSTVPSLLSILSTIECGVAFQKVQLAGFDRPFFAGADRTLLVVCFYTRF